MGRKRGLHRSWRRASRCGGGASPVVPAAARALPAVPGAAFPPPMAALSHRGTELPLWPGAGFGTLSEASVWPQAGSAWPCGGPPCPSERGGLRCLVHEEPCGELTCARRRRALLWLFVLTALASPPRPHPPFLPLRFSPPLTSRWVASFPWPLPAACVLHALLPFLVSSSMRYPKPSHLPSLPDSTDQPPLV